MFTRMRAFLIAASAVSLIAGAAVAQAPAAAPAAGGAQPRDPNGPVLTENYQDWTLRCFNVRGPAPCDMLQVAVNKQTQQRVISFSLAYVPERSAYALQIVAPLGVQLGKGLTLNAGDKTLKNIHFTRCGREGCFIEILIDPATVDALARLGATTNLVVYPYGRTTEAKLPLSLKGFSQSVARLKVLAAERATHSAPTPHASAPAAPAPAAPVAHAPAAPAHPATPPHH